jgi:N-acyl-D-amino-acid deacylase
MTSAPANRLGFKDRGLLRPGMKADIVAFDPGTIIDTATYEEPRQYPRGIQHVFINGRQVAREGQMLNARPGRVIRR